MSLFSTIVLHSNLSAGSRAGGSVGVMVNVALSVGEREGVDGTVSTKGKVDGTVSTSDGECEGT